MISFLVKIPYDVPATRLEHKGSSMILDGFLKKREPAILALAEGSIFPGYSIGAHGQTVGEVVFNTSMTGYQEIMTDPSYHQQIVTLTYPHIGNVGVNPDDEESSQVQAAGLVIRELSPIVSNWRGKESLSEYLIRHKIVAIAGVDTRRLTRLLREKGAQNGCIITSGLDPRRAVDLARDFPGLMGADLAKLVTTKKSMSWNEGLYLLDNQKSALPSSTNYHVVVYDFGVKSQILRLLKQMDCRVTVVPAKTSAEDVMKLNPDGVCLSNGPGDPAACDYAIEATKVLLEKNIPVYGICLGCQILALACGAKTVKMKFGHHGANHPVQDIENKKVYITSQNHGFAVDEKTLPDYLKVTHVSLFDGSIQGIAHKTKPAFAFQGHPEASPGPHDIRELFKRFIESMSANVLQVT